MKNELCATMLLFVLAASVAVGVVAALCALPRAESEVAPFLIARPTSIGTPGAAPYTPQEMQKAYDFDTLISAGWNGAGTTIAIVDAYGSNTMSRDLQTFCSTFNLPSCTLNIYYPSGKPRRSDSNWAIETSLDVEWAHAVAPAAKIALVVGKDASLSSLYTCIQYAINSISGVSVISMSFGLEEASWPKSGSATIAKYHALFQTAVNKSIALFAASGDNGATVANNIIYPASDPLVTAVGGTSLYMNSDASYNSETTWSGSGAGYSITFTEPTYQTGFGLNNKRDIADVAYNADPDTGIYVKTGSSWWQVGGTSAGAPQWAGLAAIAVQYHGHTYGTINTNLYAINKAVYHDITTGNCGYFSASTGWDYPTGWGSPDAYNVVVNLP